jgi:hypothetical protein
MHPQLALKTACTERFLRDAIRQRWLVHDAGSARSSPGDASTAPQLVLAEIALETRATEAKREANRARMIDGGLWSALPLP